MIITRENDTQVAGADVFLTPASELATIDDAAEVMIIGGGEIYARFFEQVNRIYVTHVEKEINGDTFFPEINYNFWEIVSKQFFPVNEQREVAFWFEVLERR